VSRGWTRDSGLVPAQTTALDLDSGSDTPADLDGDDAVRLAVTVRRWASPDARGAGSVEPGRTGVEDAAFSPLGSLGSSMGDDHDDGGDDAAADDGGEGDRDVLDSLFATIEARKRDLPEDSYTASLFTHERGENAVLEKLGEESTEIVLAAKDDDDAELLHESADFVYHLLVLLAMRGLTVDDLRDELEARF
jgi:phosphoribosyl-ATP pyrophosphohydrolase